jgi:hypothetical protein
MSSLAPQVMVVGCPQCGTQLQVPAAMGGRQGQCLRCQGVVEIPHAASLARAPQAQYASAQPTAEPDEYALAPPEPTMPALDPSNYAPKKNLPGLPNNPNRPASGGAFSMEKSGLDAGILGGIGLMILSVVWFFGALFFLNTIFFYPPILFIVGLIAMVRGFINSVSDS